MPQCNHKLRTMPGMSHPLRLDGSQEVVGTFTVRICLCCEHTIGRADIGGFSVEHFDFSGDSFDSAMNNLNAELARIMQQVKS